MSAHHHLVGDIGGTNARFAIAETTHQRASLGGHTVFAVADFPTVEDAITRFLERQSIRPSRVCLAVAGPVHNNIAMLTNADWRIDGQAIAARFRFEAVRLINDFVGQARGAVTLDQDHRRSVAPGPFDDAHPITVLGPGTGLGLAYLHRRNDGGWWAQETEGGHAAFAPANAREAQVLAQVRETHPYVSFEALVSGAGLQRLHAAVRALDGASVEVLEPSEITARGKSDPYCKEALSLFFSALGTFAGDAVLLGGARGGVLLAGGILPRIADELIESCFVERFRTRGSMSAYVAQTPVDIIMSRDVALYGAAAISADQA